MRLGQIDSNDFVERRKNLLNIINDNTVIIIFSEQKSKILKYNLFDSNFYYLTGHSRNNAMACIMHGKYVLIKNKQKCHNFILEIEKFLNDKVSNIKIIYSNILHDGNFNPTLLSWIKKFNKNHYQILNINDLLQEMRMTKSIFEIKKMKKSALIATNSMIKAMCKCTPNIYEYELEAEIVYNFIKHRCRELAFPVIVASGSNGCILHYFKNDKLLRSYNLVLVDIGIKYENYCSDISRTFPINGKFTKQQRCIYDIVLNAQLETIKKIKPGVNWYTLQNTAEEIITEELAKIKLFRINNTKENCKKFFTHKIGHWIGLDVHDLGSYKNDSSVFTPGMILTIEPGIYIKTMGLGIRIEDEILVTQNGHLVLTNEAPKIPSEIEKLMRLKNL